MARIPFDHRILHFDGAANGIHHAAKLDQRTVACALHHTSFVHSNGGIDQVAPQRAQSSQRAVFVRAGESAEPSHVSRKDRRELS